MSPSHTHTLTQGRAHTQTHTHTHNAPAPPRTTTPVWVIHRRNSLVSFRPLNCCQSRYPAVLPFKNTTQTDIFFFSHESAWLRLAGSYRAGSGAMFFILWQELTRCWRCGGRPACQTPGEKKKQPRARGCPAAGGYEHYGWITQTLLFLAGASAGVCVYLNLVMMTTRVKYKL